MKHVKAIRYSIVLSCLLVVQACTSRFDELNIDPNNPTDAPATNILARSIQSTTATLYGERLGISYIGFFAGHTAPSTFGATYEYRDEIITGHWSALYYVLSDCQKVIEQAAKEGNANMQAVMMTVKAFTAQHITDMWGDVPYTEALKGEAGVTRPPYDTQETIYRALLSELAQAAALFRQGSIDRLGDGDILMQGDVAKWQRFCNSLRLRVAMRVSNVAPQLAAETITAVLNNPAENPVLGPGDDIILTWPGSSPYNEPWFTYLTGTGPWYAMNSTIIDTLAAHHDPRLPVYAQPVPNSNPAQYTGLKTGRPSSEYSLNNSSKIGTRFGYQAAGFSPWMRYAEVCFLKAEAYARGMATGDAAAAYREGITASLLENGITDASALLARPEVVWTSNPTENLRRIYLQKWIALFKQSHEAWAEARRTDVPLMEAIPFEYNGAHNRPPLRYPYPTEEVALNGENIAPYLQGLENGDRFWGRRLWWDTRSGIN